MVHFKTRQHFKKNLSVYFFTGTFLKMLPGFEMHHIYDVCAGFILIHPLIHGIYFEEQTL